MLSSSVLPASFAVQTQHEGKGLDPYCSNKLFMFHCFVPVRDEMDVLSLEAGFESGRGGVGWFP